MDAEAAINLVNFAYFKKVQPSVDPFSGVLLLCDFTGVTFCCSFPGKVITKPKKKKQKEGEEEEGGERRGPKRGRKGSGSASKVKKLKPGDPGYDPYDFTSSEEEEEDPRTTESRDRHVTDREGGDEAMDTTSSVTGPVALSDDRYSPVGYHIIVEIYS